MSSASARQQRNADNQYDLIDLKRSLRPMRLIWFPRVGSTSNCAAKLRRQGRLFAPAAVLTGRQSSGRGRGNHTWWSGPGSITVTFALPIVPMLQPQHVPLLAGLAIRNVAAALSGQPEIQLKWPNDLLFRGLKLAGILCERLEGIDLIGLGLNVNLDRDVPAALRQRIVTLQEIAGRPQKKTSVLVAIAQAVHTQLGQAAEHSFSAALGQYEQHHALTGRRITVTDGARSTPISGACEGIDSVGRLLIRNREGLQRVIAGQVQAF